MTNEQLIAKFNPANGTILSAEDMAIMKNLTDEQIGVLAKNYPNTPGRRSYIRLYDLTVKPEKQIFQLSTWQNLNNLRKFSNKKNLVPYDFRPAVIINQRKPLVGKAGKLANAGAPKRVVVDLTAQEAANELTAAIKKQKIENPAKANETKESFSEKMAKAKADKKNKHLSGVTEQGATSVVTQNTVVPADQDFDDGAQQ